MLLSNEAEVDVPHIHVQEYFIEHFSNNSEAFNFPTASLCAEGEVVYCGDFSNIKSFDDVVSSIKRFCLALSVLFFCFYIWGSFISPPLEYSDLTKLEGVVIEKWHRPPASKVQEEYRLRVKTDDGVKQLRVARHLVANCCFLQQVPLNKRVSLLTDWTFEGINLYQLSYENKVILDAHDVLTGEEEDIVSYLPIALILLLIGGFAYCIEFVRRTKKST